MKSFWCAKHRVRLDLDIDAQGRQVRLLQLPPPATPAERSQSFAGVSPVCALYTGAEIAVGTVNIHNAAGEAVGECQITEPTVP